MKKFLLCNLLTILLVSFDFAGTTGKLTGVVTDAATGEPLPFVNITIEGTVLGAASDLDGNFVILNIPPGRYSVKAQYIGYQPQIISNILISIDKTTREDFVLSESSVELEAVVVEARADVIKKDVTSSEASVSAEDIASLPVTEITDVIQLQSGVTTGPNGDFHIRGGRTTEIAYTLNGVSVTDAYDNSRGIEIDNSSIQELQVISGTFNAEYGNAMSGIINAVTKQGGLNYDGMIKVYSGDYFSNRDDLFANIDDNNAFDIYNIQANISGPIPFTDNKITFFLSGRRFYNDGWLYGIRNFTPTNQVGDGEAVPMNWSRLFIGQANLTYTLSPSFKFNAELLFSDEDFEEYDEENDHTFKFNPDGHKDKFFNNLTAAFSITHTLSSSSFYTLKGSYFKREFDEFVFEDPTDLRHLHPDSLDRVSNFQFRTRGTELSRFFRETETLQAKLDFTSQVTNEHMIKLGAEVKFHDLHVDGFTLQPKVGTDGSPIEPFEPFVPLPNQQNRDVYDADPIEISAYIQDKIEFNDMIINLGFRLDYFDSRGNVLVDQTDPNIFLPLRSELEELSIEEREQFFYKDAEPKWQIGPRFGIAYPMSETGVVHFSYGHFLQIPTFQFLFNRATYKVPLSGNPGDVFGNPDLEPQTTIQYEIGVRQELLNNIVIDVTAFYKDIRDWITSGAFIETRNGIPYSTYINKDFANIKGIALNLSKAFSDSYRFDVNYTFQVAEGTNSRPEEEFEAQRSDREPSLFLIPLDWDQRHILNASFYVGGETWGSSILARYGTGLPYTPSITQFTADRGISSGLQRNSRRKPLQFTLDLRLHKSFNIFGYGFTAFLQVFNLLDNDATQSVFDDTGEPDFTTRAQNVTELPGAPNTVDEYLVWPWYYGEPRRIQFGFDIVF